MVYFIGTKQYKFVKIGVTGNVRNRLYQLNASCPFYLEVFLVLEGNYKLEKYLHDLFSKYNTKAEWFTLSPEIKEFISSPIIPNIKNDTSGNKRTNVDTEQLINLYKSGKSNIEIADIMNISIHTVRRRIKDHKLAFRYRTYKNSKPSGYYKKYNDNKKLKKNRPKPIQ